MFKSCCAFGCFNRCTEGTKLQFNRFPTDTERRNRWIAAVKRVALKPTEYSRLCSAHFISGLYYSCMHCVYISITYS